MSSTDLSEFYLENYIKSPSTSPQAAPQKQVVTESIEDYEDDFDFDAPLTQETYYAGGDEGDSRNHKKGAKNLKKIKKKKASAQKESFLDFADSLLNEEFDEYGDEEFDDFGGGDNFEDDTVSVSASVLRDLIGQLEGILGDVEGGEEFDDEFVDDEFSDDEFADDDFEEDPFEGDDFPRESSGDCRIKGDYSGKSKPLGKSNLADKSKAKTGYRPGNKGGKTGDQRLRGDYSGKPKSGGTGCNLKDKSKAKVGGDPTLDDLF